MPPERAYGSPRSFRHALTNRLKTLAAEGPWGLPELQRQIAYDRLLARLYLVDRGWIVKGATALLARELGVRATIDIDPASEHYDRRGGARAARCSRHRPRRLVRLRARCLPPDPRRDR